METKTCSYCKRILSITSFYNKQSKCKECSKNHSKKYQEEHKEEINERRRKYYQKNREKINKYQREYQKQYYKNNKEKYEKSRKKYYLKNKKKLNEYKRVYNRKPSQRKKTRERNKKQAEKVRLEVIKYYSNGTMKCGLCGCDIIDVLSIDHIEGQGLKDRKKKKLYGGAVFYRWLRNNKFPPGFRVLCRNCNWLGHLNELRKQ